jgi:hypothetical protein
VIVAKAGINSSLITSRPYSKCTMEFSQGSISLPELHPAIQNFVCLFPDLRKHAKRNGEFGVKALQAMSLSDMY